MKRTKYYIILLFLIGRSSALSNIYTSEILATAEDTPTLSRLPGRCPPNWNGHVLIPHERCDMFYQCVHGNKVERPCAPGTWFSASKQVCVFPSDSECQPRTTTSNPVTTTEVTTKPTTLEPTTDETTTETTSSKFTSTDTTKTSELTSTTDIVETEATTTDAPETDVTITSIHPETDPTSPTSTPDESVPEETTATVEPETEATSATDLPEETTTTEVATTTPAPGNCPSGFFGNVPHPYRCDSYFFCTGTVEIQFFCAEGFEYDQAIANCVPISEGGCTWRQTSIAPSTTENIETDPTSTTSTPVTEYTTTDESVPEETTTTVEPETEATSTTDLPEQTTTPEVATTSPAPANCPNGFFGNVPHPYRCDSYFFCTGTVEIQFFCAEGFEYDQAIANCVPISEGGCTWRQTSIAPSTTENIETDPTSTTSTPVTEYTTTDESVPEETTTTVEPETEATSTTDLPEETTTPEVATTSPAPANCPNGFFGNVPHPYRCDSYFFCTGTVEIQFFCAEGFEYDQAIGNCVPISEGGCTWRQTSIAPSTTENIETDPTSTTSTPVTEYTTTDESVPEETTTTVEPETEVTSTTDLPEETTTPEVATTSPAPANCPNGFFGNVPHPYRCDSYFFCTGTVEIQFFCAEGFEYDQAIGNCVPISEGGCTWRQTSIAPSTTENIETDPTFTKSTPVTEYTTTDESVPEETTTTVEPETEVTSTTDLPEETTTPEVATTSPAPANCPNGFFGNVPHPYRCDSYFFCTGTVEIQFFCAEGFEYDQAIGNCVPISEGGCTWRQTSIAPSTTENIETDPTSTTSTPVTEYTTTDESVPEETTTTVEPETEATSTTDLPEETTTPEVATTSPAPANCPNGFFGNVPHPYRCDSYFFCTGTVEIQFFCAEGFEYDQAIGNCVPISEGGCTWRQTSIAPSTTENIETDPTSTTSTPVTEYTTTDESVPEETTTTVEPETEVTSTTDLPEETTTPEVATTSPAPANCPNGFFGNVPHPYRCDSYFFCTGTVEIQFFCAEGFEYDQAIGNCVPISEGGCTWRQTSIAPSTTENIETDPTSTTSTPVTEYTTTDESVPEETTTTVEPETEATSTTDLPEETTTTEVATTSPAPANCPNGFFGNVPHPYRCDSYFFCTGTVEIQFFCAEGFEYDQAIGNCVPISEGGCTWRQTSIAPSTTENIETDPTSTTSTPVTEYTTTDESVPEETTTTVEPETEVTSTTDLPEETTTPEVATTSPAPANCPNGFFGNVPHPYRCDSYFFCTGTVEIQSFCAEGFEYDQAIGNCVPISEGGCTWRQTSIAPSTTENIETDPTFTKSTPVTEYTTTDESVPEETTTTVEPETEATSTTDLPEETTTPEVATTSPAPANCPNGFFGNVPHPYRCDSYFFCTGTVEIQFFCAEGFEYDQAIGNCVPISDGGCTSRQTSIAPSTTENTETDPTSTTSTPVTEYTTTDESVPEETTTTVEPETEATSTTDLPEETTTPEVATTSPAPGNCPSGFFGNIPHPYRCDSYFFCTGTVEIQFFCAEGFEYDQAIANCGAISEGGCTWRQTSVVPSAMEAVEPEVTVTDPSVRSHRVFCPEGHFGNVPHPEKCGSYIMCAEDLELQLFCSIDSEYDPTRDSCVSVKEGGCTLSANGN